MPDAKHNVIDNNTTQAVQCNLPWNV